MFGVLLVSEPAAAGGARKPMVNVTLLGFMGYGLYIESSSFAHTIN